MAKNTAAQPEEKKTRKKVDPTIKAMTQLDELSFVLNWVLKKHKSKKIKDLITT
jgi:cob(I)alamin adenosyltransferase